jgi:hypothetical protein
MEFKEYYILGCDAVKSDRRLPMFQGNVLLSSSESQSKPSKQ